MIIPTVFVKKGDSFEERFYKVIPLSKHIQIDFMDGIFVPNTSISLEKIPDLNDYPNHFFEAHLMVNHPKSWIPKLKEKGFHKVIFHYETQNSDTDIKYVVALIKRNNMEPMLAINPETKISDLARLKGAINEILLLGIHPGKEHQNFIEANYTRVKQLKQLGFFVQVDGGVNPKVATLLAFNGCDAINSGSFISSDDNPQEAYNDLNRSFKGGEN